MNLPPTRRPDEVKTCTKCFEVKTLGEFSPNRHLARGRQSQCKECCARKRRETRNKQTTKNNNLRQYGITTKEWDAMYEAQGGGCLLCGRAHSTETKATLLVVDHNHDTGQVRGLLCSWCNRGLGMFSDNPALLLKAAEYLNTQGNYGTTSD